MFFAFHFHVPQGRVMTYSAADTGVQKSKMNVSRGVPEK